MGEEGGWTGVQGHVSAWLVYGPLGRLTGLVVGDSRRQILDEVAAGAQGKATVLDVGAGWGYLTFDAAQRLPEARFICLDSEQMLRRLRQEAEKRGLGERVRPLVGSAYRLELDSGSLDVAVAQDVFHELKSPALALEEMVRVVRPGGRVIVADIRGDTWIGRLNGAHHGPRSHGAWRPKELEKLFVNGGLRDVNVSTVRQGIIGVGTKPTA